MYTLHLTQQQVQLIADALVQLPYRLVAQTIADIEKQVMESESKAGESNGNADTD